jgi:transposase-like protein
LEVFLSAGNSPLREKSGQTFKYNLLMLMETNKLNLPKDFFKQFKNKEEFNDFFQSLFRDGGEAMLQAELDEHLGYGKHSREGNNSGNSRNGSSQKTVKSESLGDMVLNIPRNRNSSFDPQLVPKHCRMSDKIEETIIGLYARGMSTSDIEDQVKDLYGVEVSSSTVSNVTNRILEQVKAWQSRLLETTYLIVWMDGISFKIRHNGKIVNKTIYLIIGLDAQGYKQVLGMWINETESASFWLTVLTDIKARGVKKIHVACTDNLTGLTETIQNEFSDTISKLCIVHQIRNSCRYVVFKDRKAFASDMKQVYGAPNLAAAEEAFKVFTNNWSGKYGYAVQSYLKNWVNLTAFFDFPLEIRKIIYTTNVIESLNSTIRKYTKIKTVFPDDSSVLKAVFLAINNIEKKWTMTIHNFGIILNQFFTILGE